MVGKEHDPKTGTADVIEDNEDEAIELCEDFDDLRDEGVKVSFIITVIILMCFRSSYPQVLPEFRKLHQEKCLFN